MSSHVHGTSDSANGRWHRRFDDSSQRACLLGRAGLPSVHDYLDTHVNGSAVQDVPRCGSCEEPVTHDPVFAAICGDPEHASLVWHPLCLMDHRENLERALQRAREYFQDMRHSLGDDL